MARDVVTADELQRIATAVRNAADRIEDAVKTMRNASPPMDEVLIHATTFMNQSMPRLIDWAVNVQMETRVQSESFALGVRSKAEKNKIENDRRKARESASKQAEPALKKTATKKRRG